MKRIIIILSVLCGLVSCSNNQNNIEENLIGQWKEFTTGINGEFEIIDLGYNKSFLISKSKNGLAIVADYGGKYKRDKCDNILFDGNELTFRKQNEDGSFNHYKLKFDKKLLQLAGIEKSWNGNTYDVKYKKIKL